MKILHITADHKWTGPAEPMLNSVLGLRARGHQVDLACAPPPPDVGPRLLERESPLAAQQVLHEPVARLGLERAVVCAGYRSDD